MKWLAKSLKINKVLSYLNNYLNPFTKVKLVLQGFLKLFLIVKFTDFIFPKIETSPLNDFLTSVTGRITENISKDSTSRMH